jgi:hypothetical protein
MRPQQPVTKGPTEMLRMSSGLPRDRNGARALLPAVMILLAAAGPAKAATTELAAGTPIVLRLEHHVTSAYVQPASQVYFRVDQDVAVDGRTLIAAGTLVTGEIYAATNRGMVGKPGTMALGVRLVTAVDGTQVPVEADLARQGRSRAWATVGWTVFWGLPGLITHGVNPYLEKGALLEARVLTDVSVDPDHVPTPASDAWKTTAPTSQPLPLVIERHQFLPHASEPYRFNIERGASLGKVRFQIGTTSATGTAWLDRVDLVAVNGDPVPAPTRAVTAEAGSFTFDLWAILQFCVDGTNRLTFVAHAADGHDYAGGDDLEVRIRKKTPKKKGDGPSS